MPGSDLNLDLPTPADNLATVVSKLVTALETVEADLEPRVGAGALDLTTELSLNGAPITNVGGLRLSGGESLVEGTVYMSDGDLYFTSEAGVVQITSEGALDIAGVGGIGGDYGSGDEEVTYDTASQEYRFKSDASTWSDVVAATTILKGASGQVTLAASSSLSGSKTINVLSLPSSGVGFLAYKSSTSELVDATTETLSGNIQTSDAIMAAALKYSVAVPNLVSAAEMISNTSSIVFNPNPPSYLLSTAASPNRLYIPLRVRSGDTVTAWSVRVLKTSASGTITAKLIKAADSAETQVGSTSSNNANNPGLITLSQSGVDHLVDGSYNQLYIELTPGGTTGDVVYSASYTVKRI